MPRFPSRRPGCAWPILAGELGRTDGLTRIEIDRRLSQAERRCTLTHELVYIEWGHGCRQPPAAERAVRVETARRLLPLPLLVTAAAYTTDLDYMALDCWVTRNVLDDRLEGLMGAEYDVLMQATSHHRQWA